MSDDWVSRRITRHPCVSCSCALLEWHGSSPRSVGRSLSLDETAGTPLSRSRAARRWGRCEQVLRQGRLGRLEKERGRPAMATACTSARQRNDRTLQQTALDGQRPASGMHGAEQGAGTYVLCTVPCALHVGCMWGVIRERRRQLRDCVCRMACLMVILVRQCRHERPTTPPCRARREPDNQGRSSNLCAGDASQASLGWERPCQPRIVRPPWPPWRSRARAKHAHAGAKMASVPSGNVRAPRIRLVEL